jgi:hypothetical protein
MDERNGFPPCSLLEIGGQQQVPFGKLRAGSHAFSPIRNDKI